MNRSNLMKLFVILMIGLSIRLVNFAFPVFTSDEARIAYRGYTLATVGKDELGRSFPILFNSLTDYQLPAVSYLTAGGELIFGKSDFGVRIPFIILAIALMILTYKIAQLFNQRKAFCVISTLVLIFSPALIFLSKIPNDAIVLAFLTTLLFYLLTRNRVNMILVILAIILSFTVSKLAWFVATPFVIFTLIFYQHNLSNKTKIFLSILSLFLTLSVVGFYLQIPQSERSLSENNFSIFSNITIKNGINKLRGQGLESGWPNYLEVILFNKSHFITVGFLHWLSNLGPGVYFGQFDKSGNLNFSQMGVLSKVLIIPFIWGLVYLIRRGSKKERLLLGFLVILTFPAFFLYPDYSPGLVALTLPFVAIIIAFGFMQLTKLLSWLVILAMILELGFNLLYLAPDKRNTNFLRPSWVKAITQDVYNQSLNHKTAVSDDIAGDIVSFIEWYNPVDPKTSYLDIPYPYKFRQTNIKNIKIIGFDNKLYFCKEENYKKVFVSIRDKERIKDSDIKVVKVYQDGLGQEAAYLLEKGLCIDE